VTYKNHAPIRGRKPPNKNHSDINMLSGWGGRIRTGEWRFGLGKAGRVGDLTCTGCSGYAQERDERRRRSAAAVLNAALKGHFWDTRLGLER
jgi:hypothetical protein